MMGWICNVDIVVLAVVVYWMVEVVLSEHQVCWLVPVLQRSIDLDKGFGGRMSSDMVCKRKDVWVISLHGEVSKGVRQLAEPCTREGGYLVIEGTQTSLNIIAIDRMRSRRPY